MKKVDRKDIVGGTGMSSATRQAPRLARSLIAVAALGAILAGCAGRDLTGRTQSNATATRAVAAPTAVSSDPVIAFAARARPGQDERVTLENGQNASVRVARSYHAASGRECREVVVNTGLDERLRLVCAAETGWTDARPLLRGGTGQR